MNFEKVYVLVSKTQTILPKYSCEFEKHYNNLSYILHMRPLDEAFTKVVPSYHNTTFPHIHSSTKSVNIHI